MFKEKLSLGFYRGKVSRILELMVSAFSFHSVGGGKNEVLTLLPKDFSHQIVLEKSKLRTKQDMNCILVTLIQAVRCEQILKSFRTITL